MINSSIPAEYAQQGYEVISKAGEVLEVIPRAPSKSEIAAADAQRKTLETFKQLQRRYSDVSDIERAKQRRLDNIDTNIKILSGTISNLESNNDDLVRNAAEFERKGRSVPHTILRQIEDGKKELSVSKDILEYRYLEYKETEKKFDSDIQAYIEGSKLEKKLEQEQAELERLAKQR
ncbi:hypothetical protein [Agaribacterium sp. ZY112]|uniref:hypothetical protein n=1 Tax=Agaribacterium sp. ZY112 TaxID=3233574 RepID=UPI003523342B